MAPAFYDDREDDQSHHHVKKSVLAMVKEKARRWRQRLAKKRRGHDEESVGGSSTTPSWGVSLEEYEEYNEEDPEYHGAPMYESELAPDEYKETTQHPPVTVVLPDKPILDSIAVREETIIVDDTGDSKTITETVSEMLAPAYAMVSDATQMLASKIQSSPSQSSERGGLDETTGSQLWDKGVSVKEYLIQKLEPGEEERALSQVISDTISPKKGGADGEVGVMEKLRETVASMLVADDGH
ncbi:Low-temperature-induced 65 kDa protein [Acorus calamus]|uniref:Low-temperature-induced 65 kDa protein n=1 Tax=Acorus calamus TaxID=4465 RepID=A0AAV9DFY8_ACOCL|nr:Low-temperature-induced 65 kDa protein [Acorus calamus]